MNPREPWSVNALSLALGPDRRSISKWLLRAGVKPAAEGSNGARYRLRDAVNVLADADLLGGSDRSSSWSHTSGRYDGVRRFAGRLRRVLKKRLSEPAVRAAYEALADELFRDIAECEAEWRDKNFRRIAHPAPDWSAMSDKELRRALGLLVEIGLVEESVA